MKGLIALSVCLSACAALEPVPIAVEPGAKAVYVVVHGGHTGLAVRAADVPREAWPARADLPDAEYLELGWGEREYYVREGEGVWLALRAIFWSESSAIHVIGLRDPPSRAFRGADVVQLQVSSEGFSRLVDFVSASHDGRSVLGPGQVPGSLFYASHRRFHAFETCNTWIARALREAGLPVRPRSAFTAWGLMRQVRPLGTVILAPP